MHVVAILAVDSVVAFDLAIAAFVFGSAHHPDRTPKTAPLYDIRVCGQRAESRTATAGTAAFDLTAAHPWEEATRADTVVVPGLARYASPAPTAVVDVLRRAHARGARIASVCNGAFVLAETGLLDGRRATVHWSHAQELARRHPAVEVDPSVLFVDDGDVVTSAGGAAGLDMCLHLVRRDYGADIAANTARHIVMPLQRDGGQAQFIAHDRGGERSENLDGLLRWLEENLNRPLTLTDIARQAAISVRTLNRHFRAQTGTTPLQWLIKARLHRAQALLETTSLPVEEVAQRAGFGTAIALRQHFRRALGTSPQLYRHAFSSGSADEKPGARGDDAVAAASGVIAPGAPASAG